MSLLSKVVTKAPPLPSRVYMYAGEKFGKSSWAAFAPKPIFIMTEGETGLLSLLESGRVPETAHFPDDAKSWDELLNNCRAVLTEQHDYKTLVIDTSNGAERLLSKHVCDTEFNGVRGGRNGYDSYGKGNEACIPHWTGFLQLLDQIRVNRKMLIVLLAHAKIKGVNNPEGDDYDQLRPEGIDKLWTLTHKWADIIVAGKYSLTIKDDKVKATGPRILQTVGNAAIVAGNRYGLPETIQCGNDAKTAWSNFQAAVVKAKSAGRAPTPPATTSPPAAPPVTTPPTSPPPATKQIETSGHAPNTTPDPWEGDAPGVDGRTPETTAPAASTPAGAITEAQSKHLLELTHQLNMTWRTVKTQYKLPTEATPGTLTPDQYLEVAEGLQAQIDAKKKPAAA